MGQFQHINLTLNKNFGIFEYQKLRGFIMTRIEVRLVTFEDAQNQSIAAFLEIGNKEFLLDSAELGESTEEDFELIEGFCAEFEMLDERGLIIDFDPEIAELKTILLFEINREDDEEQQRRDEKNGLYPNWWDDAN